MTASRPAYTSSPSSILLLLFSFLSFVPRTVDATAFFLKGNPVCENGLNLNINYLTCNGVKNSCGLGDTAYMYGYLTQGNPALTERVYMTNNVCIFGVVSAATCHSYNFEIDVCAVFGISYQGCPAEGSYNVNSELVIPGSGGLSLGGSWWVVVYTEFYAIKSYEDQDYEADDEKNTPIEVCQLRVDAASTTYSSSSSKAFLYGFSAITICGIGAWFIRKRRVAVIDLAQEESRVESGHFEMMKDTGVRV